MIPVYMGAAVVGHVFETKGGFFRAHAVNGALTVGPFKTRDAAETWAREEYHCCAEAKATGQRRENPYDHYLGAGFEQEGK